MTGSPKSCRKFAPGLPALLCLLFIAILAWPGQSLRAQSFSRTLDKVQIFASGGGESIQLTFSQPYEDDPLQDHQPGSFSLRFSATGSNIPRNTFKLREESAIRDYRVVQNQYAATLIVNLRDSSRSTKGAISFARDGNVTRVMIGSDVGQLGRISRLSDQEILAQAELRLGGDLALPADAQQTGEEMGTLAQVGSASGPLEESWVETLVTMVLALVIVFLVLYALVYLYNRFISGRIGGASGSYPIRHLGSFPVGYKQRVVVLDINGEVVVCGVTSSQISFLTRLGGRSAAQAKPAQAGSSQAASNRTGGSTKAPPGNAQGGTATKAAAAEAPGGKSKDPVHQFAETLKEKVRSLKRIK